MPIAVSGWFVPFAELRHLHRTQLRSDSMPMPMPMPARGVPPPSAVSRATSTPTSTTNSGPTRVTCSVSLVPTRRRTSAPSTDAAATRPPAPRSSGTRSACTRTPCRPRSSSTRPAASHRDVHADSGVSSPDRALNLRRPPAEVGLGSTPSPTTPPSRRADGSDALPQPAESGEEPRDQPGKASHQTCRAGSSHAPQRGPAETAGPAPDRCPPAGSRTKRPADR